MNNYYKSGSWNAICDVCGLEFKAEKLKKRWDGLMVCERDWEARHSLDFIRAIPDNPNVPWSRPEPTDTYISVPYITPTYTRAIAETAIASLCVAAEDQLL